MNRVEIVGRLVRDPDVRMTASEEPTAIARYSLAVKRKGSNDQSDFISCVSFGRNAEFIEKYFKKGMRIAISGHIQTGSYTNKDGVKVYTTDVIADEQEFVEDKKKDEEPPFK